MNCFRRLSKRGEGPATRPRLHRPSRGMGNDIDFRRDPGAVAKHRTAKTETSIITARAGPLSLLP